ncbi:hypothetical protein [uncultured Pseudodesulfovibrio sp.]|uniref:hypothetical protein n=1 Tax=uncultured Pseudodesulfovibrio sp. TaxID=2035858 RepID=UPI0029C7CC27|nr:hypothetical protein [uncultured Pseudodesulfovibrio sp.]
MAQYTVVPVRRSRELKNFINLPWDLYKDDDLWVPPLKSQVKQLLTPGKHPFWEHAERELFLLMDGDRPVGRIAAIVDRNHNKYHNEKAGKWGFFECVNDPVGAGMLFAAAQAWLEEKGQEYMHGPFNPSTNYEIGMLVEGWQSSPTLMMTYNPEYYASLVESSGQAKEKDLYAYLFEEGWHLPGWLSKMAKRVKERNNVTLRQLDMSRINQEVQLMNQLYCEAWADNWGFIPASDAEIAIQAKELKQIIDPEFATFLYHKGEPIGVSVVLPDANFLLKKFNGKLGLTSILKALWYKSKMVGSRFILLGIKPGYRRLGVPLLAAEQAMRRGYEKGHKYMEVSWTLEDNRMVNELLNKLGGDLYRRYRIYRKDF